MIWQVEKLNVRRRLNTPLMAQSVKDSSNDINHAQVTLNTQLIIDSNFIKSNILCHDMLLLSHGVADHLLHVGRM